ncbi:MAG: type I restriction enzyme HsdR N-terminal domain-containing protein [Muribaculaceae bacterium]|nr:type I restriction enzyme HsdR N-terminal domain-containing protein [Muribaculaceae bacterium]
MKTRTPLNLPPAPLRLREDDDGYTRVFDPLRKKWIVLTPEEWVRQHFTSWLRSEFGYPASLMANEKGVTVNGTKKRCDTVIFRNDGTPLVIVEYKAPDVSVTQAVFDQIVRYNMELHADYLIVSNGLNHYCCEIDYNNGGYRFFDKIPAYQELISRLKLTNG